MNPLPEISLPYHYTTSPPAVKDGKLLWAQKARDFAAIPLGTGSVLPRGHRLRNQHAVKPRKNVGADTIRPLCRSNVILHFSLILVDVTFGRMIS
ncbi:MAG: hypothetical protein IJI53_02230, partial [Clostridia bacterium]|nr:hypothetical protein [Clostridia bacterium]